MKQSIKRKLQKTQYEATKQRLAGNIQTALKLEEEIEVLMEGLPYSEMLQGEDIIQAAFEEAQSKYNKF